MDGLYVAVGYHFRPHGSRMGGEVGLPTDSNTSPKKRNPPLDDWPLGGHMCMYYGDSTSESSPTFNDSMNNAAVEAAEMCARNWQGF